MADLVVILVMASLIVPVRHSRCSHSEPATFKRRSPPGLKFMF